MFAIIDLYLLSILYLVKDYEHKIFKNTSDDFKGFESQYESYFLNFTSAILFFWSTKHMICKCCLLLKWFGINVHKVVQDISYKRYGGTQHGIYILSIKFQSI